MSDIVKRLRTDRGAGVDHWQDVAEAANEIERLRSCLEQIERQSSWIMANSMSDVRAVAVQINDYAGDCLGKRRTVRLNDGYDYKLGADGKAYKLPPHST